MIISLSETNRSPFDLPEGESELVRGFNVEFRRILFSLIFIAEYGIILFIGIITSLTFLKQPTLLNISTVTLTII